MILHHEFIKVAKQMGENFAIVDKTTNKKVTYSKALIAAFILAKKIKQYSDGYIGIMIPTSAGSILSVLGVVCAGKVPVMINYAMGASENCEYAQDKCGFQTIITSRALLEKLGCRLVKGMVFIEDIMERITTKEKIRAAIKSKMPLSIILKRLPNSSIEDNVVILFTSGSEKDPKAVQLTHKNLSSNILALSKTFHLNKDHKMMSVLPLFHVFGYNANCWLPLINGLTNITCANPLEYKNIPKYIKEEQATIIAGTPIFFAGYLKESEPGDFASLKILIPGADKTPEWLREGYKKKHNVDMLEAYGATETSPGVTVNTHENNRPGSIGKPLPGVKIKIVDIATGKKLPVGREGKIMIKGDLVMKGYFDDLEETSLRIKDGWYDSGDIGLIDEDGYLWHKGRLKRFVKIGGEMISLVRTEAYLIEILPDHVSCCVVEIPDSIKGGKIVAAVTEEVEMSEVNKKLLKNLPPIALPKEYIVFKELPKMGSGKVDFRTITKIIRKKISSTEYS